MKHRYNEFGAWVPSGNRFQDFWYWHQTEVFGVLALLLVAVVALLEPRPACAETHVDASRRSTSAHPPGV